VDVVAFKQHADIIAGRMWACRRQACESASRCRSTLNNELIFFTGSSSFDRLRCLAQQNLAFFAPRTGFGWRRAVSQNLKI
jgi:hypothetical protein